MGNVPTFGHQGGKAAIRKELLRYFPKTGRIYCEPFGGKGNVYFLSRLRLDFRAYWINDLFAFPFLRALYRANLDDLPASVNRVDFFRLAAAGSDIARILEPQLGIMGLGYEGSLQRNESRGYKRDTYRLRCAYAQELLRGAKVTGLDWTAIDYSKFNANDFLYFDPPYFKSRSTYGHINHAQLLGLLESAPFMWALSGYDSALYRGYLGEPAAIIDRVSVMRTFKLGTRNGAAEYLWLSKSLATGL
jgi:site-specific DNA-adenine methylase